MRHLEVGKAGPSFLHKAIHLLQQVLMQLHNLIHLIGAQVHALLQNMKGPIGIR